MSSAGWKRTYNDAMLAKAFLRDECGIMDDNALLNVPENGTVGDIRQYARLEEKNWVENLPSKVFRAATKCLAESGPFEELLHAERITYCGVGGGREKNLQERFRGQTIRCKFSGGPDMYVEAEASINRTNSVSLVLGCSGSGKTTYCVNKLGEGRSCVFRVYMHADQILGDESNVVKKFRDVLRTAILDVLKIPSLDRKLRMTLYAIIDEANGDAFFGKTESLFKLKAVVDEFAKDGHLVVSGTGLDLLTANCGSAGEAITKIRMLPWNLFDFEMLSMRKDGRLFSLVKKHDIYTKMISNARAAACLLYWLERTLTWGNDDDNVAHVVRAVAYHYIAGNGLKDLKMESRRKVVRSILKVLNECKYKSTEIPPFRDLDADELKSAQTLVDVHVNKSGKTLSLERGFYAVSISPAIAVVLAALLCTTTTIQTSWSGFETIVALDELFNLVRDEPAASDMPEFQILHLDKPHDARVKCTTLDVPLMSRTMVLVNGSKSAYADVIAPFRLIQVKHCKSGQSSARFFLRDELMKMGLLKESSTAQKVFAMAQYEIWKSPENCSTATSGLGYQLPQSTDPMTMHGAGGQRALYPASLLVSEMEKKKPVCWVYKVHKTDEGEKWYRDTSTSTVAVDTCTPASTLVAVDPDAVVRETKPVTVVFVTNGSSFTIVPNIEGSSSFDEQAFSASCVLFDDGRNAHESCAEWMKSLFLEQLVPGVIVELAFARC